MNKKIDYKIFVPKSIDLEEIEKEFPPFKSYDRDKAYYIIAEANTILRDKNSFVSISAKKMYRVGIRNFKQYWKYLKDAGVLYSNGSYVIGERTRQWCITEKYREDSRVYLIKGQRFAKNLIKKIKIDDLDKRNNNNLYRSMKRLTIDKESALKYNSEYNDAERTAIEEDNLTDAKYKKRDESRRLRYDHNLRSIHEIGFKQWRFYQGVKAGRLHTSLTNMSKDVRQFLRVDGERLYNVDFVNSQLMLSTILFAEKFYKKGLKVKSLSTNKLTKFSNCNTTNDTISEDVRTYIETVVSGEFYELFMKLTGIKSRKEVKKLVFFMLFNKIDDDCKMSKLMKKHFPNVLEAFNELKQEDGSKKPHNKLALLLQSVEAYLVLGLIRRRIEKERPDMALYTIHDSVMCKKEDIDYVSNVMMEETFKLLGVVPALSTE